MQTVTSGLRILTAGVVFLAVALIVAGSTPTPLAQSGSQKGVGYVSEEVKALPSGAKRWALIIGINEYDDKDGIKPLTGAVNDAKDLREALVASAGFDANQIILLTSDQENRNLKPTAQNIFEWLVRLKTRVPKDGLLLFAFSGHGISSNGQSFLLPSNANMVQDIDYLRQFALPVTTIREQINKIGVRQRIMLLDACRNNPAGKGAGDESTVTTEGFTRGFDFQKRNNEVDAFVILTATEEGEKAYEDMKTKRGYFMEAVVEGLRGKAANEAGEITLDRLRDYVQKTVPSLTFREAPAQQHPHFSTDGYAGDLVIAKVLPSDPEARARTEWEKIQYVGTKTDYDSFLKRFPNSKFGEFAYWEVIQSSADRNDFKTYLSRYPNGKHYNDAASRAERLLWQQAKNSQQPKDYQTYLNEYPNGDYADFAKLKLRPPETKPVSELLPGKPVNAMLLVLTNPARANILIKARDSKAKIEEGASDANGKFRANLPLGIYDIEVSAAKHDVRRIDSFKLDVGSEPLQVELTPLTGAILIGPVDADANVFLNERMQTDLRRNSKEKQIEITDVPIGHYRIRVEQKQQVQPTAKVEREIEVLGGKQVFVLTEFKPALPALGKLIIATKPDSEIYLDASYKGTTDSNGLRSVDGVPIGPHLLKVRNRRYQDLEQRINVVAGENPRLGFLNLIPIVADPTAWPDDFGNLDNWDAAKSWRMGWEGKKNVIIAGTELGLENRSDYDDFDLEFNVNIIKGNRAAWALRAKNADSYYLFVLEKGKDRAALYVYLMKDGQPGRKRKVGADFFGTLPLQFHIYISARGGEIKTYFDKEDGNRQLLGTFSDAQELPIGKFGFRAFENGDEFVILDLQCRPKH